jgi:dCTP deaminase
MSILCDTEILEEIEKKTIVIRPFDPQALGTNSYDVHLGPTLATYDDPVLDVKKHNKITTFHIPPEGYVLQPGEFYLGVTREYTETHHHVPILEGKSGNARLSLRIHETAGFGDVGFCNYWTLEISCTKPVRIYAGMPIAQIFYHPVNYEKIKNLYHKKPNAKYNQVSQTPTESRMYLNQF